MFTNTTAPQIVISAIRPVQSSAAIMEILPLILWAWKASMLNGIMELSLDSLKYAVVSIRKLHSSSLPHYSSRNSNETCAAWISILKIICIL